MAHQGTISSRVIPSIKADIVSAQKNFHKFFQTLVEHNAIWNSYSISYSWKYLSRGIKPNQSASIVLNLQRETTVISGIKTQVHLFTTLP